MIAWETWKQDAWSGGSPLPAGLERAPGEKPAYGALHRGHEIRVFRLPNGGYRSYVLWSPGRGFAGTAGYTKADVIKKTRRMIDRAGELRRHNPHPWTKVFA